jgi:hypothetical protein
LRAAEDWDCWARLAEVAQIAYITDVLSSYQIHTTNLTHRHAFIAWGEFRVYLKNLRRAPKHMRARIILAMLTRPLLIPVYLKFNSHFREAVRRVYRGRSSLGLRRRWHWFRSWLRPWTRVKAMLARIGGA